ncbi:MAG: DUF5989 family protein [Patescibacteria group bacterium]
MSKLAIVKEFFHFLVERKKWWLMPILFFFIIFGLFIFATQGSVLAPFIYALF